MCDIKGKSIIMNFINSTEYYGCTKCLHPEKHNIKKHYYSFDINIDSKKNQMCTDEHVKNLLSKLLKNPNLKSYKDIKIYSVLTALSNFSLISHCVVDTMHCLWKEIVFQFFKLWFKSKYCIDTPLNLQYLNKNEINNSFF